MDGGNDLDIRARDRDLVARVHLDDVAQAHALDQSAASARRDDAGRGVERAQRGEVEMVAVRVRDQDAVECAEASASATGALRPQRADAAAQQRVGQQPGAAELEQHRRVAEEDDPVRRRGHALGRAIRGGQIPSSCFFFASKSSGVITPESRSWASFSSSAA